MTDVDGDGDGDGDPLDREELTRPARTVKRPKKYTR